MANPTTNYGWPMPTSTDLVTDLPADFALFGQPVDTTLKALNPQTTTGALAYRSATSNVNTALPIGSTGQVLTVASGVPSWATASSGALVFIKRASFSAVATTTTSFDTVFTTTYKDYMVVIESLHGSVDNEFCGFNYRGGGVSQTGDWYGATTRCDNTGATVNTATNGSQTYLKIIKYANQAIIAARVTAYCANVGTGSSSNGAVYGNGTTWIGGVNFGGAMQTASTIDGFILSAVSGTITGTVAVYGLATS